MPPPPAHRQVSVHPSHGVEGCTDTWLSSDCEISSPNLQCIATSVKRLATWSTSRSKSNCPQGRVPHYRQQGRSTSVGYDRAQVAIIDATRLGCMEMLADEQQATIGILSSAVAWFNGHRLECHQVMSDRSPAYLSCSFALVRTHLTSSKSKPGPTRLAPTESEQLNQAAL